jgi:hypothetical protein
MKPRLMAKTRTWSFAAQQTVTVQGCMTEWLRCARRVSIASRDLGSRLAS